MLERRESTQTLNGIWNVDYVIKINWKWISTQNNYNNNNNTHTHKNTTIGINNSN